MLAGTVLAGLEPMLARLIRGCIVLACIVKLIRHIILHYSYTATIVYSPLLYTLIIIYTLYYTASQFVSVTMRACIRRSYCAGILYYT